MHRHHIKSRWTNLTIKLLPICSLCFSSTNIQESFQDSFPRFVVYTVQYQLGSTCVQYWNNSYWNEYFKWMPKYSFVAFCRIIVANPKTYFRVQQTLFDARKCSLNMWHLIVPCYERPTSICPITSKCYSRIGNLSEMKEFTQRNVA
jgi:hypothetical protein